MHYYKRNLGDYAKKAGRLSMLQHGSYTLLIDACYDREQFPTMAEAIEWTWASSSSEIEAVEFVLGRFFVIEDGRYIQTRIREELAEYHDKAITNKRIADEREANRRRIAAERELALHESLTNREPTFNEPSTERHLTNNQEPITNNQEPITKNQEPITHNPIPITHNPKTLCAPNGDATSEKPIVQDKQYYTAQFIAFWEMYPRKKSKGDAVKAFGKVKPSEYQAVRAGLEAAIQSPEWKKNGGEFIPYPASWLNSRGWEDEMPKASGSTLDNFMQRMAS